MSIYHWHYRQEGRQSLLRMNPRHLTDFQRIRYFHYSSSFHQHLLIRRHDLRSIQVSLSKYQWVSYKHINAFNTCPNRAIHQIGAGSLSLRSTPTRYYANWTIFCLCIGNFEFLWRNACGCRISRVFHFSFSSQHSDIVQRLCFIPALDGFLSWQIAVL